MRGREDAGMEEEEKVRGKGEKRKRRKEKKGKGEREREKREEGGKEKGRRWRPVFAKPEKGERVAAKTQGVGKQNCQGETLGFEVSWA